MLILVMMMVVHLGTMLDIQELIDQWKTVVVTLAGMLGILVVILTVGTVILGKETAAVAAPPLTGGFAAAEAFLKEGAKVAICSRHEEELKEAAEKLSQYGEVYYEAFDVSKAESNYAFAEHVNDRFGSVDVWVNNVGATGFKKGDEYDDEEIDFMTGVCFKSVIYGCQAAFRYMKKQRQQNRS